MLCYTNIQVFENNLKYSFLFKLWFLYQEAKNRTKRAKHGNGKICIYFSKYLVSTGLTNRCITAPTLANPAIVNIVLL